MTRLVKLALHVKQKEFSCLALSLSCLDASFGALKSGAESDAAKVKVGGAAKKAAAKAEASKPPVPSTPEAKPKPLGGIGD